jgi:hypothetical protein
VQLKTGIITDQRGHFSISEIAAISGGLALGSNDPAALRIFLYSLFYRQPYLNVAKQTISLPYSIEKYDLFQPKLADFELFLSETFASR